MKNIRQYIFIAGILLLGACATVPLTGRKRLSIVDDSGLRQEASLAYQKFLKDPEVKVIKGTSAASTVQRVGSRISAAVDQYLRSSGMADQYNYQWEFNLVQDKNVNAWCMPGGKVAVFSGLIPVAKTDAGLAAVMGHEIAHAIAQHSAERASQMILAQAGGVAVGVSTAEKSAATQAVVNQLYGIGGQLALLNYSRRQESEADKMGLIFMAMAGYNPNEAVTFWERMQQANSGQQVPELLSTHPSDERRIRDLQKMLPEAMQYYRK